MLARPRQVYRDYLRAIGGKPNAATGRMEVELEIEARIRILREICGTSLTSLSKEEILTTLESLLNSLGERELVERTYNHLEAWRQLRMERIESSRMAGVNAFQPDDPGDIHPHDLGSPTLQLLGQTSPTLVDQSEWQTVELSPDPDEEGKRDGQTPR